MKRDLFARAGEALFGTRWQTDLARALGINERTMRRWVAGQDMPEGVDEEIRALLVARAREIDKLLKALEG